MGLFDRTVLTNNDQETGQAASIVKLENILEYIADLSDENYNYVAGLILSGALSSLGWYNVADYGAVGDGVTDDTTAIDNAIAAGGILYLPNGKTYKYLGSLSTYIKVTGVGKVVDGSGNPHPRFVQDMGTTALLSSLDSYIALLNLDYSTDDGTRIYIIPKAAVTSGVGGVIKIFGDPYHLDNVNYRDLGIYFSANQAGDLGVHGQGVFWVNGKVNGTYVDQNPDIGFSFQDGMHIAGRFALMEDGVGDKYTCLIVGFGKDGIETMSKNIRMAVYGEIGFNGDGDGFRWLDGSGAAANLLKFMTDNITLLFSGSTYLKISKGASSYTEFANAGGTAFSIHPSGYLAPQKAIIEKMKAETTNTTTPNVTDCTVLSLEQTAATTITNMTGVSQKLTVVFTNSNTTIQNNANIVLQGGVNFVGKANDVLNFIRHNNKWIETSRSVK